ncbi:universal stress protein [Marmoricola sp. URHB0036]|uniref:universal stress protein n=1 Tax=Marmoricola sp. URHB0036 TaxID=1298863 RepID=UPI0004232E06|nr:universal stress protein [Marmoricola sp. URHB0036]
MTPQGEQHVEPATIVVGIDGSPASRNALDWALEQAGIEGRSLTLLHAIHPLTRAWQEPGAPDPSTAHRRALLRKGTELLEHVLQESNVAHSGVPIHHLVRIGDPSVVLPEVSVIAELVVVGSRGRGPIRTLLLGSTAVALVRHARCPVVVHRADPVPLPRHGIAVGVDDSHEAGQVLDFAFAQAQLHGEPLNVVHAQHFRPTSPTDDPYAEPSWADGDHLDVPAAIQDRRRRYPDVVVSSVIRHGTPGGLLVDLADEVRLLVVGIHRRGRAAELTFGATAVWLVEHASCPVAAVPLSTVPETEPARTTDSGEQTASLARDL